MKNFHWIGEITLFCSSHSGFFFALKVHLYPLTIRSWNAQKLCRFRLVVMFDCWPDKFAGAASFIGGPAVWSPAYRSLFCRLRVSSIDLRDKKSNLEFDFFYVNYRSIRSLQNLRLPACSVCSNALTIHCSGQSISGSRSWSMAPLSRILPAVLSVKIFAFLFEANGLRSISAWSFAEQQPLITNQWVLSD